MSDLIVLFPPHPESLTTSKLTDFRVFLVYFKKIHEKHIRQHIIQAIYSHLQ